MSVRITCIKKDGGYHENHYTAISTLSWVNESTGNTGTSSRLEIYDFVVGKGGTAYVKDAFGNFAYLIGEISPRGTKYVKTRADNVISDNLLKLPECA